MDLSDLRIFCAVVDEGGITRAADRLFRVQSSVTTRVRQLEADLGTALFSREGRKLVITPAGRTLYDYAGRLLALADEAREAVTGGPPTGIFRLGSMESTAAVRLPSVLAAYSGRFPDVTFELRTGNPADLSVAVRQGEIDAAFVAEPVAEAEFNHTAAFSEQPVLISSAQKTDDTGFVPRTMIVFEQGCPHRRLLEAWYRDQGGVPERTVELRSYHAMIGCVLAGMGTALVPESVLASFPETDGLSVRPLPGAERLETRLIWKRGLVSSRVAAMADLLRERTDTNRKGAEWD